jgi:hypothetical protein
MTRHLKVVGEPSRGPRRLNSRAEIDAWIAERWATLNALMEAERAADAREPEQLELGRVA